jgi:hypothetical protein
MQNFITLGQPLLGEKYVIVKKEEMNKYNPEKLWTQPSAAMSKAIARTSRLRVGNKHNKKTLTNQINSMHNLINFCIGLTKK